MRTVFFLTLLALVGCAKPQCKGEYTERDSYGNLKKFNEHSVNGQCMTDNVSLSQWENSSELRAKKGVRCTPQPITRTLVSANNFYSYRDGRVFLDLNGSTGEFRKLTIAEGKSGQRIYTRLQGCFYQRSDSTFGDQLLLDTTDAASSQYFDPMEIFTYSSTATTMEMVRFDDSSTWDYRFCPYLDTPDSFCALLRNGNEMYFPTLTAQEKSDLLAEAILIRRQYNFVNSSTSSFNSVWNSPGGEQGVREDYKIAVQAIVDTPRYIDQQWIKFLRRQSNSMPDLTSNTIPPLCYFGRREITLNDGSTSNIYGQICYEDGEYTFQ